MISLIPYSYLKTGGDFSQMMGKNLFSLEMKMRGLEDTSSEEATLKSLIKVWDLTLQMGSKAMKELHGTEIPMDRVPESARKDPYLFFKFFEKRFHRKAKDFKKKLYRVSSIILQKEDPLAKKVK